MPNHTTFQTNSQQSKWLIPSIPRIPLETNNLCCPIRILSASLCQPRNPGGFGCWAYVALDQDGAVITYQSGCLGHGPDMSNNRAAYHAVIEALRWASRSADGKAVEILTPVRFIADQLTGAAECNAIHLQPLRDEAVALL